MIISGQDQNVNVFPGTHQEFQPCDMDGHVELCFHPWFDENEEKRHCLESIGA